MTKQVTVNCIHPVEQQHMLMTAQERLHEAIALIQEACKGDGMVQAFIINPLLAIADSQSPVTGVNLDIVMDTIGEAHWRMMQEQES